MSPERKNTPDIIKVIETGPNFNFEDIEVYDWEENPSVREYTATVGVRVFDVESILMRCERAWQKESGIFFEYPSFKDGFRRCVRIIDCVDDSYTDKTSNVPAVLFRVVLQQEDFDDFAADGLFPEA